MINNWIRAKNHMGVGYGWLWRKPHIPEHPRVRILEPVCSLGSLEAMESGTVTTVKGKWEPKWSWCRTKPSSIPMPSLRP